MTQTIVLFQERPIPNLWNHNPVPQKMCMLCNMLNKDSSPQDFYKTTFGLSDGEFSQSWRENLVKEPLKNTVSQCGSGWNFDGRPSFWNWEDLQKSRFNFWISGWTFKHQYVQKNPQNIWRIYRSYVLKIMSDKIKLHINFRKQFLMFWCSKKTLFSK